MTIGFLITNGGPHSVEKWAEATASHIVEIADHVSGEKRGAAIKLQAAIIDVLEKHHGAVQDGERAAIKANGHDQILKEIHSHDHVSAEHVADEIIAAAQGTAWEEAFNDETMHKNLCDLLTQHFRTSMHVERSWHADRNPNTEQAKAFKERHHSEVEGGAA
jgi:hypothetical protein